MDSLDPTVRSRILRVLVAVLGIAALSILIGLAARRPADTIGSAAESTTVASAPSAPAPQGATATPRPTPSATATSAPTHPPATLTPTDGWLIRSLETFDHATTWPAGAQEGWASGYEDGRYWLKLNGQRTISYRVPLDSPEFRITVDLQVKSGNAGLLFLAGESNSVYRFVVDNTGRYRLGIMQAGEERALKDWTADAALKAGADAVNQIEVRRVENELTLFANGKQLAAYTLPPGAKLQAQVGMALDALSRDSGALAYFDNLAVRVPLVPESP
jgi:hypothetical protein